MRIAEGATKIDGVIGLWNSDNFNWDPIFALE